MSAPADPVRQSEHALDSTEEAIGKAVARRLAELRLRAGLSQQELSRMAKIGVKNYATFESGFRIRSMKIRYLIRLARFYKISLSDLLGDVNPIEAISPDFRSRHPWSLFSKSAPAFIVVTPTTGDHTSCHPGSSRMCADCKAILDDVEAQEAAAR
jgi:transcriptional regulator with XRE-family HTH domain